MASSKLVFPSPLPPVKALTPSDNSISTDEQFLKLTIDNLLKNIGDEGKNRLTNPSRSEKKIKNIPFI